ncbi:hypothetical protein [Bradyrhizobium sp. McL0616]|uniref:hypothetical protein n=1 Tax=Bradyrhizobium sp. McL0616 TaxID=3415674 RepID=UPI003CF0B4BE
MALALILVAMAVEAGSAIIYCWLRTYPQSSRFLWRPDLKQVRANWDAGSSMLDRNIGGLVAPELGPDPEFGDGQPCGSAYGDSFTSGYEVAFREGWAERLSHMLGCRIVNYAVGGYGIDQAYRRFESIRDGSRFALLGLDTNGIMDVVSQYDGWLGSEPVPTALKGRFVVDPPDQLSWIPLPELDADKFVALNRTPSSFLPRAYFLPGTRHGAVFARFPYTLTLARVALMPSVRALIRGRAEWSSLYQADDPSGALRVAVAISEAFAKLARARGQRPLIVVLPVSGSFREAADFGQFEYISLVQELRARNIEVLDVGPTMLAARNGRSACDYFTQHHTGVAAWLLSPLPCGGHYSGLAHAIIAQLVYDELKHQDVLEH